VSDIAKAPGTVILYFAHMGTEGLQLPNMALLPVEELEHYIFVVALLTSHDFVS
jgi:hypothetical protein